MKNQFMLWVSLLLVHYLQQWKHDVSYYLNSCWRSLYFWETLWRNVPSHNKCSIECWKDIFWITFVQCCDDGSHSFYDLFWSELWDLGLQFLPSYPLLLWIELLLVCILSIVCWKRSTYFLHIILEWTSPMILGGHKNLAFSLNASSCSLIWETLVKWGCMVFEFCIFTFLS